MGIVPLGRSGRGRALLRRFQRRCRLRDARAAIAKSSAMAGGTPHKSCPVGPTWVIMADPENNEFCVFDGGAS
jgi:hypothetical protein